MERLFLRPELERVVVLKRQADQAGDWVLRRARKGLGLCLVGIGASGVPVAVGVWFLRPRRGAGEYDADSNRER